MTTLEESPAPPVTVAPSPTLAARAISLRWVSAAEWWWLALIAALGAIARAGGLSTGTLYRDDAWVALTHRVALGTATRMVVTTPGFVLAERFWTGWFPHSLLVDQLPTFVASVAGIVIVGRLARWWGLSAPASLVAAGVVAASLADVQYATRLKPYAFDLLGACLILWLAERLRRNGAAGAWWLAAASVGVCCVSLTPVPLVVGVWVVLVADAAVRRRLTTRLVASAVAAAIGLAALYVAVRGGISPRLRHSWIGNYLVLSSPHGLVRSVRTITSGLVGGLGDTTPGLALHGLGSIDRVALIMLVLAGLVAWRRQLLGIGAIVAALAMSVPSLVPIGTGRTDAYLYPALAMLVAEGATVAWHLARRAGTAVAVGTLVAALCVSGLVAVDRVTHRPTYPGGNFAAVAKVVDATLAEHGRVVIGGTARWPWAYYVAHRVDIGYSDLYNNGYFPRSDDPRVVVIPGSPIEGGYAASAAAAVARVRGHCGNVVYVESSDWPSMPMSLLRALTTAGGLVVLRGPVSVPGYRYWILTSTLPCPSAASHAPAG